MEFVTECSALEEMGHALEEVGHADEVLGPSCLLRGEREPKTFQGSSHTLGFEGKVQLPSPTPATPAWETQCPGSVSTQTVGELVLESAQRENPGRSVSQEGTSFAFEHP